MLKSGGGLTHKAPLTRPQTMRITNLFEWVRDHGQCVTSLGIHGWHTVPQSAAYKKGNGAKLVKPLLEKAKALGVKTNEGTRLVEIFVEDGVTSVWSLRHGLSIPEASRARVIWRSTISGAVPPKERRARTQVSRLIS